MISPLYPPLQRQFGGQAGAEELQGPAAGSNVAVLWPLPGELLRPLCYLSGVCRGQTSGAARTHLLQGVQHPLEVSDTLIRI